MPKHAECLYVEMSSQKRIRHRECRQRVDCGAHHSDCGIEQPCGARVLVWFPNTRLGTAIKTSLDRDDDITTARELFEVRCESECATSTAAAKENHGRSRRVRS